MLALLILPNRRPPEPKIAPIDATGTAAKTVAPIAAALMTHRD
jgi:hypothetical protein